MVLPIRDLLAGGAPSSILPSCSAGVAPEAAGAAARFLIRFSFLSLFLVQQEQPCEKKKNLISNKTAT